MFAGNKIDANHLGDRLAHHRPTRRWDERILGRYALRKLLSLHQGRVFYRSPTLRIRDLAIGSNQVLAIHLPLGSRKIDEQIARSGSHFAQLQIHGGRSPASEGSHVEGSELGVAHHQLDFFDGEVKFLGDTLAQRGANVLTDFHLSRVYRDLVVLPNV